MLYYDFCLAACGNSAGQAERPSTESNSTESADQSESVNVNDIENTGFTETQQPEAETPRTQGNKVLVAYLSATGTTEGVAEHIANGLNADIYEIIPKEHYTDAGTPSERKRFSGEQGKRKGERIGIIRRIGRTDEL